METQGALLYCQMQSAGVLQLVEDFRASFYASSHPMGMAVTPEALPCKGTLLKVIAWLTVFTSHLPASKDRTRIVSLPPVYQDASQPWRTCALAWVSCSICPAHLPGPAPNPACAPLLHPVPWPWAAPGCQVLRSFP